VDALPPKLLRYLRIAPLTRPALEARPPWAEARALARPAAWRMELPMWDFQREFAPHAARSGDLARTMAGCSDAVLLAVTIGKALEMRAAAHFDQGRSFAGYLLDKMGSFLAESTMKDLHAALRQEQALRGLRVTRRYSPGYGDFSLEAQACFLRLAGPALPDVTLSSGFMLSPTKSITAVCGIKP